MFSPSAEKSMTPRSERPMRRWISTVRPSGRPLVTSRCLRSPVEAGSIPYSAVTQPRPLPASHFGTPSVCEAVQITRVSPALISTEPVAVATKPGSMVDRPQLVGAASVGALAHAAASAACSVTCSTSPSGSCRKVEPSARKASTSPVVRKR